MSDDAKRVFEQFASKEWFLHFFKVSFKKIEEEYTTETVCGTQSITYLLSDFLHKISTDP